MKMGRDHSHYPLLKGLHMRMAEWTMMEGASTPKIFVYLHSMGKMLLHIYPRETFPGQVMLLVEAVGDIFMESLAQRCPISRY